MHTMDMVDFTIWALTEREACQYSQRSMDAVGQSAAVAGSGTYLSLTPLAVMPPHALPLDFATPPLRFLAPPLHFVSQGVGG